MPTKKKIEAMAFESLTTGAVFRYPYLWHREAGKGETEGRKERPVAVALRVGRVDGLETIIVIPITTKMPEAHRFASEIPDAEKKRAGLNPDLRLWIVLDEANIDVVGKSYYLTNHQPIGRFSTAYFVPIVKAFAKHFRSTMKVDRTR